MGPSRASLLINSARHECSQHVRSADSPTLSNTDSPLTVCWNYAQSILNMGTYQRDTMYPHQIWRKSFCTFIIDSLVTWRIKKPDCTHCVVLNSRHLVNVFTSPCARTLCIFNIFLIRLEMTKFFQIVSPAAVFTSFFQVGGAYPVHKWIHNTLALVVCVFFLLLTVPKLAYRCV